MSPAFLPQRPLKAWSPTTERKVKELCLKSQRTVRTILDNPGCVFESKLGRGEIAAERGGPITC